MVFSQTSQKTHSILKVVEIDRLKAGKNQQANGLTGEVTHANLRPAPSSPVATTSFSEEYLKPEPLFESTMFHDTDCEFFQDLVQWCSDPAKEEQVQTIDPAKVHEPPHTDTIHTQFSPQGWDAFSANSPTVQAGYYPITPNQLSPVNFEGLPHSDSKFLYPLQGVLKDLPSREQFLDISSLPVVIGDLEPEKFSETNPWLPTESVSWNHTHDTNTFMHNNTMSFINQEDSTDMKYTTCVIPREVESNNVVIREFLINNDSSNEVVVEDTRTDNKRGRGLAVDLSALAPSWLADTISTPEVLSYVEQLEEKDPLTSSKPIHQWPSQNSGFAPTDKCATPTVPTPIAYEPVTPKSESHTESENDVRSPLGKRRHDSEDSDETYTPDSERPTTRRYKRRKPNVPLKDMILALEGSQQLTKARRGRPPKRRESNVSSVCSVDDNSSTISTYDASYRGRRDKNNEASKRSRMNRKLKELQMEQLVVELEERNKKLKVRAQTLEEMTKRLKEAFMTAILKK